jgi:hypothetical protein
MKTEFKIRYVMSALIVPLALIVCGTTVLAQDYDIAIMGGRVMDPEYRAGVRWEPSDLLNVALTFGDGPGDGRPPGRKIGVLFYSRWFDRQVVGASSRHEALKWRGP